MEEKKKKSKTILIVFISIIVALAITGGILLLLDAMAEKNKIEFIGNKIEEIVIEEIKKEMKQSLKNPNSLAIHNIAVSSYTIENSNGKVEFYKTQEELKEATAKQGIKKYGIHFEIDYSAQNGFGGMNRKNLRALIYIEDKEKEIFYSKVTLNWDN